MKCFGERIWRTCLIGQKDYNMAIEVQEYDEEKLFKIARFNLRREVKD
jgi:hypothetical protein